MPFVCLGGGGEGFFTDRKIALSSPNPFVPDEKERALSLEKARLAQGLANGSPRPLPFPPLPRRRLRLLSLELYQPLGKERGGKAGRDEYSQQIPFLCSPT